MTSSKFENEALKHLRDISGSARQAGNALVEIGKMIKEYLGTEVDFAAMQANIDQLNELARQMERAQPGDQLKYAADADGKMKMQEWMHNLNVHYELVNPNAEWNNDMLTKDEFWTSIETLVEKNLIMKVSPPRLIKDANQLPIPQLIESMGIAEADFSKFIDGVRVRVIDKDDENYLRQGVVEGIDDTLHRARVRFDSTSEGVLIGMFHYLQLAREGEELPHNNVNHCVASGCTGECGEEENKS